MPHSSRSCRRCSFQPLSTIAQQDGYAIDGFDRCNRKFQCLVKLKFIENGPLCIKTEQPERLGNSENNFGHLTPLASYRHRLRRRRHLRHRCLRRSRRYRHH